MLESLITAPDDGQGTGRYLLVLVLIYSRMDCGGIQAMDAVHEESLLAAIAASNCPNT